MEPLRLFSRHWMQLWMTFSLFANLFFFQSHRVEVATFSSWDSFAADSPLIWLIIWALNSMELALWLCLVLAIVLFREVSLGNDKALKNSTAFIPQVWSDERHTNGQCSWTWKGWEATAKVVAVQRTSMMKSSMM